MPGSAGLSCRSKAVVLTAFCSSPVSRVRLSVNVSAMRNSTILPARSAQAVSVVNGCRRLGTEDVGMLCNEGSLFLPFGLPQLRVGCRPCPTDDIRVPWWRLARDRVQFSRSDVPGLNDGRSMQCPLANGVFASDLPECVRRLATVTEDGGSAVPGTR